jgi:serine phosphatase RsbU (regulator of sigma subunit)
MGLAMGVVMRLTGMIPEWVPALLLPTIFCVVMWPGFETFGPLLSFDRNDPRPPGKIARGRILRVVGIFAALFTTAWLLVLLTISINLRQFLPSILISFLIGLCISGLVSSFHTVANLAEVERERARAESDRQRKTEELEQARALQLSMLPTTLPKTPGLELAFGMRTATEVGGDYYDYRVREDGTLHIAVGDATGHGVRAGLLVAAVKTLFQTGDAESLAAQVQRISEGIRSLRLQRMNMALAVVALGNGGARLAAGGMPPALHFRASAGLVEEILVEAPPPGQMRRAAYFETAVSLPPGDRLLLLTDGLPECRNAADELFGYERVSAAFARNASKSPDEIVAGLFAEADAFAAGRPYEDDITLAVIGVPGGR